MPDPVDRPQPVRILKSEYVWSQENQSGAAYLRWDSKNLYVALDLLDQVHHPSGDGESVIEGDSVVLAFDPTYRSREAANLSFAYYVSSQRPAGGSGSHTLWRPRQHAAGRPHGHLARDSSVHEIAVKADGSRCVYELKIPWSELGVSPAFGAKFGFSIQSNDNDGNGLAAQMTWGGGLAPSWRPGSFGAITLIESR